MKELLTRKELQVIRLLAQGKKNKEIGLFLGISEHTVESHLQHIYEKLSVSSRTEAILIFLSKEKFNGNP